MKATNLEKTISNKFLGRDGFESEFVSNTDTIWLEDIVMSSFFIRKGLMRGMKICRLFLRLDDPQQQKDVPDSEKRVSLLL